ncbi:MAG: hypothetical protein U0869_17150 [Chloroflexota bacterium]
MTRYGRSWSSWLGFTNSAWLMSAAAPASTATATHAPTATAMAAYTNRWRMIASSTTTAATIVQHGQDVRSREGTA